jgi:hypothetical protein
MGRNKLRHAISHLKNWICVRKPLIKRAKLVFELNELNAQVETASGSLKTQLLNIIENHEVRLEQMYKTNHLFHP